MIKVIAEAGTKAQLGSSVGKAPKMYYNTQLGLRKGERES